MMGLLDPGEGCSSQAFSQESSLVACDEALTRAAANDEEVMCIDTLDQAL